MPTVIVNGQEIEIGEDERLNGIQVAARNLLNRQALDMVGYPLPGRSFFVSVFGRVL